MKTYSISAHVYSISDIRAMNPCMDPGQFLPEDWKGGVTDILSANAPVADRLWVACHWLSDDEARAFAAAIAGAALSIAINPDERITDAMETINFFVRGMVGAYELEMAYRAAKEAFDEQPWNAAIETVYQAAHSNAQHAAFAAAQAYSFAQKDSWSETLIEILEAVINKHA